MAGDFDAMLLPNDDVAEDVFQSLGGRSGGASGG